MKIFVFQKHIFSKKHFFRFNYHNRSVAFACTHPGLVRTKGDQVGSKGTKQTSVSKMIKFIKKSTWELFWPWRLNGGCELPSRARDPKDHDLDCLRFFYQSNGSKWELVHCFSTITRHYCALATSQRCSEKYVF